MWAARLKGHLQSIVECVFESLCVGNRIRSSGWFTVLCGRFDLDYTLAQYRPETFEVLAHTETVKKLISNLGYPKVFPPSTHTHTLPEISGPHPLTPVL